MVDLNSNFSKIVFDNDVNIRKFVIDLINKKMYITNGTVVYRMSFDGSDKEMIYNNKYYVIQELAFDWIGRHIFWVFSKKSTIYADIRIFLPGTSPKEISFPITGKKISSLKIDAVAGYVVFIRYPPANGTKRRSGRKHGPWVTNSNNNGHFEFAFLKQTCCCAGVENGKNSLHRQERGQEYGHGSK